MLTKQERPRQADAELNRLEHTWWEQNAALVARFWEMDSSISNALRTHYLLDAKRFFFDDRNKTNVLELGCGSGWVGQSIAGDGLSIIGTDFSQAQLNLARNNARSAGLEDNTKYILASSDEWPKETASCDSVLIHSFLHHLDGLELENFLDALHKNTAPGTRILLFEPAYHDADVPMRTSPRGEWLFRLASRMVNRINADLKKVGAQDEHKREQFVGLFNEANAKGWYLSPKEVPFGKNEFTHQLASRFKIVRSYWAVIYTIGWAFERNLLLQNPTREHWLWPYVVWIDRQLAKDDAFLQARLRKPAHAFHVWQCIRT